MNLFNKKYVSAIYSAEHDTDTPLDVVLSVIMNNHRRIKHLFYENVNGTEVMVFPVNAMKRINWESHNQSDIMEMVQRIISGRVHKCTVCGCIILSKYPYTYRDNCGCISRSYECCICRGYKNKEAYAIYEHQKKHGSRKAVLKAINCDFGVKK